MSLDYISADIRQVVQDIVGDVMSMPVIIDPGVGGKMTLNTARQVPASEVPRLLDKALALHGYGLAAGDHGVRVGRLADLAGGIQSNVQVIPVRYVDPAEVIGVIRPNLEEGVRLTPAPGGRGIVVSGPPGSVSSVRGLVGLFDTDAMLHKSFALYTLSQASPADVERELSLLFTRNGQGRGPVQFAALERLNGILVVAEDPAALKQIRQAIVKLDTASEATAYIHVRPLLYRRASEAAQVLAQTFGAEAPSAVARAQPAGTFGNLSVGSGASNPSSLPVNVPGLPAEVPDAAASRTHPADETVMSANRLGLSAPVRIQADPGQNALVILAAPHDYKIVEAAIRQLDVKPRQVLIQAIVAEVRLSNGLRYGVDYLLSTKGLGAVPNGLSYVFPDTDVNIVLHGLSGLGDVKVVSAPRILAVDNQTATIQVGDQVPILVRSSQSVVSENSPIVSDVELRDTGVILAVTPRIGAGGSVTLDTFQEVSTGNRNTLTNVQSPVISVRRLQSTVSTRSGDTIAIGGLMQDSTNRANSGIPVLKDIPLLGGLFRSTEYAKERTELLILLNPRVVDSDADARALTEELREKFESLAPDLGRRLTPSAQPQPRPSLPRRQRIGSS
ncbi:secretin N-terminal domain-containing protein [Neomesorhizobium albiziae]|uniref:secretin N-terminal domain-containing protein n=1 Tax=Neomesorhizobium albiziae TaxID=335020 RepID=UPI00165FA32A|nr:secretin N-terminal domain-containing protein [Mesorhizobium albiziae]GLS33050.1 type II secretion system protein GspD [Mesorhizobium albiziae]